MTTVVHVSDVNLNDPDVVYIGRRMHPAALAHKPDQAAKITRASKWANPFKVGDHRDRREAVTAYREWLAQRPDLLAAIPELRDKRLACWCFPLLCHGDVLAELANAMSAAEGGR